MIESEKIILRPLNIKDSKELSNLRSDFEATKAFAGSPFPSNLESEKEWISNMYPKGIRKEIHLAVVEKGTQKFVGYCVAKEINYLNRNANVGIIFSKDGRGKGYYKDVSFLFYNYLFNEINLHKIYSLDIVDNIIAVESDKKYGFRIEGKIKEHIWQDGKYKDMVFVSLFRKDFNEIYNKD